MLKPTSLAALLLLLPGTFSPALAQQTEEAEPQSSAPVIAKAAGEPTGTLLAPVVVSGKVSGPGLWRADRNGQTLWILGSLTPLPRHMEWEAEDVSAVLDEAGALIGVPYISVKANVGFWGGLALAPKALGARKDPEGRTLEQQLPADVYARWSALRERYLGSSRKTERWRPLFAADYLVKAALRKSRLSSDDQVEVQLRKLAKKRKVSWVNAGTTFSIDDPKAMLSEFRSSQIDDQACFEQTLEWLERDLDLMRARANAWAEGDIGGLHELATKRSRSACIHSLLQNDLFRSRGIDELPKRQRENWLSVVEETLAKHGSALSILTMEELLGDDSYLADLQSAGFVISSPE
ncbi:MAG: TraB/GumN family protein [Lysobacteraceae bacterium]|nr:TraB/GumN family protein [Xanthomonadales bacterium]MCP5477819.1 TraB/GumN family protein [Rhodanobacteraceae bacterium]HPF72750.1 TraB/GumN family protein [Xanthomonadaceae bacterium]HRX99726.1 TraB/GumN family protein [Xanthomonadaceae bacterium]